LAESAVASLQALQSYVQSLAESAAPMNTTAAPMNMQWPCNGFAVVLAMSMQTKWTRRAIDQLSRIGCDSSCAKSLGQYSSNYDIDKSVKYVLKGLHRGTDISGTCDFLNFHRVVYTGWQDCRGQSCSCDCTYDCKAYTDATADSANIIRRDTSYLTNGKHVCQNVPRVR